MNALHNSLKHPKTNNKKVPKDTNKGAYFEIELNLVDFTLIWIVNINTINLGFTSEYLRARWLALLS